MEQSQRAPEIQPSKQRIKELPGRQINSAAVCAHNREGQLHPGLHQKKSVCQVKGGDSHEDRVEVMVSTQEWCGSVTGSSEKGYKGEQRKGTALVQKEIERYGVVQHGVRWFMVT